MENKKITKENVMEFMKKHWKAFAITGACGLSLLAGTRIGKNANWSRTDGRIRWVLDRNDNGIFDLYTIMLYKNGLREREHGMSAKLNWDQIKYVMQYFLSQFKEEELKDIVDTLSSFSIDG